MIIFIRSRRIEASEDVESDEAKDEGVRDEERYIQTNEQTQTGVPDYSMTGTSHESGYEVLEYPPDSENWWWKDTENECWVFWE